MLRLILRTVLLTLFGVLLYVHALIMAPKWGVALLCVDACLIFLIMVVIRSVRRGHDARIPLLLRPFAAIRTFFAFLLLGRAYVKKRTVVIGTYDGNICYYSVIRDRLIVVSEANSWMVSPPRSLQRFQLDQITIQFRYTMDLAETFAITLAHAAIPHVRGSALRLDLLPNVEGISPTELSAALRRHMVLWVYLPSLYLLIIVAMLICFQ